MLLVAGVVGGGLMSGLLFAFSCFVMTALSRLPSPQSVAAMQSINVAIVNPLFLSVFLGTAAVSILLAVHGASHLESEPSPWVLAGGLCYLVGVIGVTMIFNIPLNNILASAQPTADFTADTWSGYITPWLCWNHVRTVLAVIAVAAYAFALSALKR